MNTSAVDLCQSAQEPLRAQINDGQGPLRGLVCGLSIELAGDPVNVGWVFDTLYDFWGRFIDDAYPFLRLRYHLFAWLKIGTRFGILGV